MPAMAVCCGAEGMIKKEQVGEATKNARQRAEKMVEQTDVKVGKIVSVRSGVFQITERR